MPVVLVFILVVMWSVYFGMGLMSARERRSMNSIAAFHEHLDTLARAVPVRSVPGRPLPGVPAELTYVPPPRRGMTLAEARTRRRHMLTGLAAAASVTAALSFVFGGPAFLLLHLLTDALFVGYVVVLVRTRHTVPDRRSTVIYLPRPAPVLVPEPVYLQRSAN